MTSRAEIILAEFDRMDQARGALRVAVLSGQEELAAAKEFRAKFVADLLLKAPTCWDEVSPLLDEARAIKYLRHVEQVAVHGLHHGHKVLHRAGCAGDCPDREVDGS